MAVPILKNRIVNVLGWIAAFALALFGLEPLQNVFFPSPVDSLERLLQRSRFVDCSISIQRRDEMLELTVLPEDGEAVTSEIYGFEMERPGVAEASDPQVLRSVNHQPGGARYATQTSLFYATPEKEGLSMIEVSYCADAPSKASAAPQAGDAKLECNGPLKQASCPVVSD